MESQLYIDGEWRTSSSGTTFPVLSPPTGHVIGVAHAASTQDVLEAIGAAQRAQPSWEALSAVARRAVLFKAADLLTSPRYLLKLDELTIETGAVKDWVRGDAMAAVSYLRESGCLASNIRGQVLASNSPMSRGAHVMVEKRAHGVILSIAPWNSALALAARCVAVPLIFGNTVVLKSSEVCPATHALFVQLLHEAGLPKGVLNLLHIAREDAPVLVPEIIRDPRVRHVNFTGSDRVGRIIATEAAKVLKPVVLELGGKGAAVVLDDANVEDAARSIIAGAMMNSGQICMSTERVIVQRGISAALIDALKALASKIPAGTSTDTSVLGSLFSPAHAQTVVALIQDAQAKGGELILGDGQATGSWMRPHIVVGYKPGMDAWAQESFGPLLGITIVDTVDEAVELANDTEYSLTSSLWTTRLDGLSVARRIRVGSVMVNGSTFNSEPGVGIHGVGGRSGYGKFDMQNFTREQVIVVNQPGLKIPFIDQFS